MLLQYKLLLFLGLVLTLLLGYEAEKRHWIKVGRSEVQSQWEAEKKTRQAVAGTIIYRDGAERVKVETVVQEKIVTIYKQGKTIEKEIPVYITATDNSHCTIPTGFVRLYNQSTGSEVAGTPAEPDHEASGITLSEVASADVENNANHRACIEQVKGWQEFYQKLQENRIEAVKDGAEVK